MARRFKAGDEPVPGYRLVEFLGRGGFGEVWKATGRGVDVALKIIDLGGKTGYKEFKALKLVKRIRHPNLVPIVGFWLTDEDGAALDESQVDTSLSGLAANSDSATTGTM